MKKIIEQVLAGLSSFPRDCEQRLSPCFIQRLEFGHFPWLLVFTIKVGNFVFLQPSVAILPSDSFCSSFYF